MPNADASLSSKNLCSRIARDEFGGIAIMGAITLPVVIGGIALGAETGHWYMQQRKLQHAADVAAYAGALRRMIDAEASQVEAVVNDIVTYTTAGEAQTVTVNITGKRVEVIVSKAQRPYLASLFLAGNVPLQGRAVAEAMQNTAGENACMLTLAPTAPSATYGNGSFNLNMPGCSLVANSTSDSAIALNLQGGSLTASCLYTAGGTDINGAAPSCIETNAMPVPDPYRLLAEPDAAARAGACSSNEATNASFIGQCSVYLWADAKGTRLQGIVNLNPGLHIIDNELTTGVQAGNDPTITGDGVTLYFGPTASFNIHPQTTWRITAPSSGDYKGIAVFASRDIVAPETVKLTGQASSYFTGAVYAPTAHLELVGGSNSSGIQCTQVIAYSVEIKGNAEMSTSGCEEGFITPIETGYFVALVE